MSYLPPHEQEQTLVISTKKPMRRWLQIVLKTLAVLAIIASVVASLIGWRYYVVHKQLKHDLTQVIRQEEHVRALGGINVAPDMLDPHAPESWRFRYISSVRARRGLAEPEISVKAVDYDGNNARVHLLINGVSQHRHYRLYSGKDWRRAPFIAKGWGQRQEIQDENRLKIIFWGEDETFAKKLMADLPVLMAQMQSMGRSPSTHIFNIVPQEFDDLVHAARVGPGLTINSPHVDVINTFEALTPAQNLRLSLARNLISNAQQKPGATSSLPAASRIQLAINDLLAWQWAADDVADAAIASWAQTLQGQWVSPITGLSPTAITELPPDASDAAAHLMMAWILRKQGADALITLNRALARYDTWDALYRDLYGLQAEQVEAAAQAMITKKMGPAPAARHTPAPTSLTLLTTTPDAHGRVLAQTPDGETILLQAQPGAHFTLLDGSNLGFDCVASGSKVSVQGRWLEQDRRLEFSTLQLEQASLPPILRSPAMDAEAQALFWRYKQDEKGDKLQISLVQSLPNDKFNIIATPLKINQWRLPPTFSRPEQPPLMLWTQSVRCDRDWLVAYDPSIGTTDAWLLPGSNPNLWYSTYSKSDGTFDLIVLQNTGATYRTAAHHILQKISDTSQKEEKRVEQSGLSSVSDEQIKQISQLMSPYVQAFDKLRIIPNFGLPDGQMVVAVTNASRPANPVSLFKVTLDEPLQVDKLFEVSAAGFITSLALCPDGSYLYGLNIVKASNDQGILRLHRASGEDVALSALSDELYAPLYCAHTPQP